MQNKLISYFTMGSIALFSAVLFPSCIREAAKNSEADIISCTVNGVKLIQNPTITNDEVRFYVNGWEDVTALAPEFTITEGATIDPASGTVRDFSSPQTYTVTSEDGNWSKIYKVSIVGTDVARKYSFENVNYHTSYSSSAGLRKHFHKFYELIPGRDTLYWASGNPGFLITNQSAPAEDYPTAQSEDGYVGKCVKLVTRSTGRLGAMFKSPIAAGNIFLGDFQINLSNTLKSTHFGVPYSKNPLALTGYYKYTPGEQITDIQNLPVEGVDNFDIYAVFFEPSEEEPYLDGTNVRTHESILKIGQIAEEDKICDGEWHRFVFEFQSIEGRTIDEEKLRDGKYSISIVMTSSVRGAEFTGAVGSTLYVDEVELFSDEDIQQ